MHIVILVLFVLGVYYAGARDANSDAPRRPRTPPRLSLAGPPPSLPGPSALDPVLIVNPSEPRRRPGSGTAFSIDSSGRWLTARHVTDDCDDIVVQIGPRQGMRARRLVSHPRADVAYFETGGGSPALAIHDRLSLGGNGFHFGFPQGEPGDVHSRLIGRSTLEYRGQARRETAVIWAEVRRVPDSLPQLGGLSGSPVVDAEGTVVGITIRSSERRGRVLSADSISIREILHLAAVQPGRPSEPPDRGVLTQEGFPTYGDILRDRLSVAKVFCLVADDRGPRRPSIR